MRQLLLCSLLMMALHPDVVRSNELCHTAEVSSILREIEAEEPGMPRFEKATALAVRLKDAGAECITDGDVQVLSRLMMDEDDSVRFWAAAIIGNSGPHASAAIPSMKAALIERPCEDKVMTSAGAIRHALRKLGEEPPAAQCLGR